MAEEKGKMLTCNRCGETVFLKFEGLQPQEWSNPKEKYEKAPGGWVHDVILGHHVDLCPECTKEWVELQTRFMKKPPEIKEE